MSGAPRLGGRPPLDDVREDVRRYITDELLGEDAPEGLDERTPLISSGIVDSVALEQLLFYLEERYGLAPDDEDLSVERFETIDRIARFVTERVQDPTP